MTKKRKSDSKIQKEKEVNIRLSEINIEKAVEEYLRYKIGDQKAVDLIVNNEAIQLEKLKKEELRLDIENTVKKSVKEAIEKIELKKKIDKRNKEILEAKKLIEIHPDIGIKIPNEIREDIREEKAIYIPETFSIENIYDSKKFWNSSRVKKPTLLELEKYYKIAVDREFNERSAKCWIDIREERNKLLQKTDWTQLPDVTMSQKERLLYRKYRNYLRDKPKDYKDDNIQTWKILSFEEFKQMNFPE
jgi:hypothetical protein